MNKTNEEIIEEFKEEFALYISENMLQSIACTAVQSFILKALEAKDAEHKEEIEEAFFSGFGISGEGLNGEYPFQDHNIDPREDERIKKRFKAWKEEKLNQLKNVVPKEEV